MVLAPFKECQKIQVPRHEEGLKSGWGPAAGKSFRGSSNEDMHKLLLPSGVSPLF